jgi:hypothetical protein
MKVDVRTYLGVHDGVVHAILIDVNEAHKRAGELGDRDGQEAILRLWLEHFNDYLGNMPARKLLEYVETRPVWRRHEDRKVIKNPDEPAMAYTAQVNAAGDVTLILLGICYRFTNGSEEDWWRNVILPRLRRLQ